MKKVVIAIVVILMLACAMSGCSKQSQDIKYTYKTGETLKYKFWMSQQTEFTSKEAPAQRLLVRFFCDVTPVEQQKDITTLKLKIHNAGATLATDEGRKPLSQFKALNDLSFTVKQKSDGTITELTQDKEPNPAIAVYSKTLNQTFKEIFPTLPERLTTGTSWHKQTQLNHDVPGYGNMISTTKTALSVLNKKEISGHDTTEISASFTIDFDTDKTAKAQEKQAYTNFASSGTGKGSYYFDEKAGILVASKYDTTVNVSMEMQQQNAAIANSHIVKSHIEFQLIDAKQTKVQQ